jgi:hypothetical protein
MTNSSSSTDTARLAGAIARQLAWAHRVTEAPSRPASEPERDSNA